MKALTVQQPWAWAIIHADKDIENRTTLWKHRGPLAIHAGARNSARGMRAGLIWEALDGKGWTAGPAAIARTKSNPFHHGTIIGVVDVVGAHVATLSYENPCCENRWAEFSHFTRSSDSLQITRVDIVHLVLANPRPVLFPVRCKGRLGLWTVPADVEAAMTLKDGPDQ